MTEEQKPPTHGPKTMLEAWQEANQKSRIDQMTGLLNHETYSEQVKRLVQLADKGQAKPAIINIDLDRFKQINDTYGHAVGDEFLKAFSGMLSSSLRTGPTDGLEASDYIDIGRLGGDEFGVLVDLTPREVHSGQEEELTDEQRLAIIEDRITKNFEMLLSQEAFVKLKELGVGLSFGSSIWHQGLDSAGLEQDADAKMYAIKAERKASQPSIEETRIVNIVDRIGGIGAKD